MMIVEVVTDEARLVLKYESALVCITRDGVLSSSLRWLYRSLCLT